jgi:methylmalonyl-CoA mutase N-terminal domain/subunit
METLFNNIPSVSTSMTINPPPLSSCLYVAVAKTRRQFKNFRHRAEHILRNVIARGTYIYPVRPAMRIVTDIRLVPRHPKWNTISISATTSAKPADRHPGSRLYPS